MKPAISPDLDRKLRALIAEWNAAHKHAEGRAKEERARGDASYAEMLGLSGTVCANHAIALQRILDGWD